MPDIAFVSANQVAAGNTVTMPAHVSGDLLLIFAYRDANNTPPTLPAGWTNLLGATGSNVNSFRLGYKIAASGSETSGTWSNTTGLNAVVYRYVSSVGAVVGSNPATSGTTITYPALTRSGSPSYIVRGAGHRTPGTPTLGTNIPAGYTERSLVTKQRVIDSNGYASSNPTADTQTVGTSDRWVAWTLELVGTATSADHSADFFMVL